MDILDTVAGANNRADSSERYFSQQWHGAETAFIPSLLRLQGTLWVPHSDTDMYAESQYPVNTVCHIQYVLRADSDDPVLNRYFLPHIIQRTAVSSVVFVNKAEIGHCQAKTRSGPCFPEFE